MGLDRIVIVGASLAGLRAAEELRTLGHTGTITLVGDEPHRPYERPPLSKQVLAGTKPPESTALSVVSGSPDDLDLEWRLGQSATGLDLADRAVLLGWGRAARVRRAGDRHRRVAEAAARHRSPRRRAHAAHARRLPRDPCRARQVTPPGGGGRRRLHRRGGGGHLPWARDRCEPHRGAAGAARARSRPRDGRGRGGRPPRPWRGCAPRCRGGPHRRRRSRRAHPAHRWRGARHRPRRGRDRRHAQHGLARRLGAHRRQRCAVRCHVHRRTRRGGRRRRGALAEPRASTR